MKQNGSEYFLSAIFLTERSVTFCYSPHRKKTCLGGQRPGYNEATYNLADFVKAWAAIVPRTQYIIEP